MVDWGFILAWAGIFLSLITSRHAVGSKQPCIPWTSKAISSWAKHFDHELVTHVQLMLRLRICGVLLPVPCTPSYVVPNCYCLYHHFHDDTSHLDCFICLILSLLLITSTDNKLIFHQNFVQFLSLTSCHVITQNILHHKYKSQPVYMVLSQFHLPPILSTYSYLPKNSSYSGWSIKFQCNNVYCGAELC